jgi:LPXTG-motif cell wall-anchored protein
MAPDGSTAYVSDYVSHDVIPVTLGEPDVVGTPIPLPSQSASSLAITPDGKTLYVADSGGQVVYPIPLDSGTPGKPITAGFSRGLAVTPDGKTVYVANNPDAQPGTVTPISTATNKPGTPITVSGSQAQDVAFSPDQAPVAALTVHPGVAGQASSFDASTSTVKYGTIASYKWTFGDGATATTTTPKTTHTYAKAGNYPASVTETDSAGTSTTVVFTGRTVSRNGGPSAVASAKVTVTAHSASTPPAGGPAAGGSTPLPNTGTDTQPVLYVALALLLTGALALMIARRRDPSGRHR